ncbi:hypothetical protein N9U32_00120 [Pseudomonadota bacterium]|nr:hypothetical protein [Pseudomonadota bacterium]
MKKTNFILDIFFDYKKNKQKYCLWRWCSTCGNMKIRNELFIRSITELEIKFEETGMKKNYLSLSNIRDINFQTQIIELILKKLNELNNEEIELMLSSRPFYNLDVNKDDFIKFIIMELYESLYERFSRREELLKYLYKNLTNEKIKYVMTKMNTKFVNDLNFQQTITNNV